MSRSKSGASDVLILIHQMRPAISATNARASASLPILGSRVAPAAPRSSMSVTWLSSAPKVLWAWFAMRSGMPLRARFSAPYCSTLLVSAWLLRLAVWLLSNQSAHIKQKRVAVKRLFFVV